MFQIDLVWNELILSAAMISLGIFCIYIIYIITFFKNVLYYWMYNRAHILKIASLLICIHPV